MAWKFDPLHTQVEFSAKHLGMMTVRGTFNDVTTEADLDPEHPEKSTFTATIKTESIRTHNEQRDRDHAVALSQGQLVFPVTAVAGPTVDEYQRGRVVAPDLISDRGAVVGSRRAEHDTIVA